MRYFYLSIFLIISSMSVAQHMSIGAMAGLEYGSVGGFLNVDASKFIGVHLGYSAELSPDSGLPSGRYVSPSDIDQGDTPNKVGTKTSVFEVGLKILLNERIAITALMPIESSYLFTNYSGGNHTRSAIVKKNGFGVLANYTPKGVIVQFGFDSIKGVVVGVGVRFGKDSRK